MRPSATHLLTLIEQILSLSRIEARRDDVRLESIDARTIVTDACALVQPIMAARQLTLDVCLPDEARVIETDVTKVRQILLNLMTNAGKFTERGSVRCTLRLESEMVVVEVSDTGRGIGEQDLPRVFEAFWQGAAIDHARPEGVGLGLSVSRRLARLLGGDITVTSVEGQGSSFRLWLPPCAPNADQRAAGWRHEGIGSYGRDTPSSAS